MGARSMGRDSARAPRVTQNDSRGREDGDESDASRWSRPGRLVRSGETGARQRELRGVAAVGFADQGRADSGRGCRSGACPELPCHGVGGRGLRGAQGGVATLSRQPGGASTPAADRSATAGTTSERLGVRSPDLAGARLHHGGSGATQVALRTDQADMSGGYPGTVRGVWRGSGGLLGADRLRYQALLAAPAAALLLRQFRGDARSERRHRPTARGPAPPPAGAPEPAGRPSSHSSKFAIH